MYLIVGLGNPGEQYENTPHNSGFHFIEKLRLKLKEQEELSVGQWSEDKLFQSSFCKIEVGNDLVAVLQKPQTFMNRSGFAVKGGMKRFNVTEPVNNLVLVHDDLDLKLGNFKIQREKSPKAHNGVADVESSLGFSDFLRVRIGVDGRLDRKIPGDKYVLTPYNQQDLQILDTSLITAVEELLERIQL